MRRLQAHSCKPRVLIIREDSLRDLMAIDESQVSFESGGYFHVDRLRHLKQLGACWEQQKHYKTNSRGRRLSDTMERRRLPIRCGRLRLSVPAAWL